MGKLQNRIAVITGASTGIGDNCDVAARGKPAGEHSAAGEHALCRPGMKNYFIPLIFKRRPILPG